jgi:glycosyltransferase A (GT-A) superfamily protein (DUF2064 family)
MSALRANGCAIAVMVKAPQAGRCNTQLSPPLSPKQAALLRAAFLRDMTENIARAARVTQLYGCIAYAPAGLAHSFAGQLAAGTGLVLADGSAEMPANVQGVGRGLLHAVQSLLAQGHGAACVLNADSPTLPTRILAQAATILAQPGDRAVLGPSEDGGYYLLGLKQAHAHLFADIAWGTAHVAEQTTLRARQIGLELVSLPHWYGVHDAASLTRLLDRFSLDETMSAPFPAPATRACVARLGLDAANNRDVLAGGGRVDLTPG